MTSLLQRWCHLCSWCVDVEADRKNLKFINNGNSTSCCFGNSAWKSRKLEKPRHHRSCCLASFPDLLCLQFLIACKNWRHRRPGNEASCYSCKPGNYQIREALLKGISVVAVILSSGMQQNPNGLVTESENFYYSFCKIATFLCL